MHVLPHDDNNAGNGDSLIDKLKEFGLRDKVKIMVGGAPVSPAFAKKIGADGYTSSAIEAVEFAKNLVEA